MRALVTCGAILVLLAGDVSAQATPADLVNAVKAHCAKKWDTNYRMQMHCRNTQLESFGEVMTHLKRASKTEEEIISRCLGKWHEGGDSWNWRMVRHCRDRQIEAYRKLR